MFKSIANFGNDANPKKFVANLEISMLYDYRLTGLQKPKAKKVNLTRGLLFATASESPLPQSARHFGERTCRSDRDEGG